MNNTKIAVSDLWKMIRDDETFSQYAETVFDCGAEADFNIVEDKLRNIFEQSDDPHIACALGCLLCDARHNGGKPDYDAAYRMFVAAAANGINYARCRLADLYALGLGCRKSLSTARDLVSSAYDDALDDLCYSGQADDFTECAMRMARIREYGLGSVQNIREAYGYCLEALLAARISGDETAHALVKEDLKRVQGKLPERTLLQYVSSGFPWFLKYMLDDGSDALLSVNQRGDGDFDLTVKRTGRKTEEARPMLMTFPEISCSILSNTLIIRAVRPDSSFAGDEKDMRFDDISWIYPEKILRFIYRDCEIGKISCSEFRVYPQETESGQQTEN